jgi:hypothetical protein
MNVTDSERRRSVSLLVRDVTGTVSPGYESVVNDTATHVLEFVDGSQDFEERLVEEVQQYLHDTFVDTTWPRCPEHSNHPLWYSDGWWRCEQTGRAVAPLGGLSDALPIAQP